MPQYLECSQSIITGLNYSVYPLVLCSKFEPVLRSKQGNGKEWLQWGLKWYGCLLGSQRGDAPESYHSNSECKSRDQFPFSSVPSQVKEMGHYTPLIRKTMKQLTYGWVNFFGKDRGIILVSLENRQNSSLPVLFLQAHILKHNGHQGTRGENKAKRMERKQDEMFKNADLTRW